MVASLLTCALACLVRKDITKYMYVYGLFPGLLGLTGFNLHNRNFTEKIKFSGVPENKIPAQSYNDVKLAMIGLALLSIIADVYLLKLWKVGKITGASLAYLTGAAYGEVSNIL